MLYKVNSQRKSSKGGCSGNGINVGGRAMGMEVQRRRRRPKRRWLDSVWANVREKGLSSDHATWRSISLFHTLTPIKVALR